MSRTVKSIDWNLPVFCLKASSSIFETGSPICCHRSLGKLAAHSSGVRRLEQNAFLVSSACTMQKKDYNLISIKHNRTVKPTASSMVSSQNLAFLSWHRLTFFSRMHRWKSWMMQQLDWIPRAKSNLSASRRCIWWYHRSAQRWNCSKIAGSSKHLLCSTNSAPKSTSLHRLS